MFKTCAFVNIFYRENDDAKMPPFAFINISTSVGPFYSLNLSSNKLDPLSKWPNMFPCLQLMWHFLGCL